MSLLFYACSKEKVETSSVKSSEKILKESKDLQLYIGDITKNQLLKNGDHSASNALQEIDNIFGKHSTNEKIFKLVGAKLDYHSLVKSREKAEKVLRKIANINEDMESTIDMVSDMIDVTVESESPQAVYHYHALGEQLEEVAVDFESNHQSEELNTQVVNNLQGSLYNTLSSIETNVNLDISLSNVERQTLLNVLLLLKTTIISSNFGTAIINFANSLVVENIFETISHGSLAAKGFFSCLFKAIVGAVVVVATSAAGFVLGSAFGFAGGIIGAASGFYWGLEAVEALFGIDLVNYISPKNKPNYLTI